MFAVTFMYMLVTAEGSQIISSVALAVSQYLQNSVLINQLL